MKLKPMPTVRLFAAVLALVTTLSARADTGGAAEAGNDSAAQGLAIAMEADRRSDGFQDYSSRLTMTLRAKNGQQAVREMRFKTLEVPGDGDKGLTLFDEPKDVAGTTLLTFAHKTADDDIWLFLPALKRVKRIAGNNKSGPFMGSEFAFEDFGTQEVEKYRYRYLRDEMLDGQDCHVIERIPVEKTSGYSRQEVWLDKAEYRLQQIHYYNKGGVHLKTLRIGAYRQYLDKFWYPHHYLMVNHDTGRSTVLEFKDYVLRNGYGARDFDQSALAGAR